jgi:hypothetical protein
MIRQYRFVTAWLAIGAAVLLIAAANSFTPTFDWLALIPFMAASGTGLAALRNWTAMRLLFFVASLAALIATLVLLALNA